MTTVTGFSLSPQQRRLSQLDLAQATGLLALRRPSAHAAWQEERLSQRLGQLLEQEEILRTHLHAYAGMQEALQVIDDKGQFALDSQDWQALDAKAQEQQLQALADAPVDCLSVLLVALPDGAQGLILRAPAVLLDSASLAWIAHWLSGDESATECLQYADYAAWRESLVEDTQQAGPRYWQSYRQQQDELLHPRLRLMQASESLAGESLAGESLWPRRRQGFDLASAALAKAARHWGLDADAAGLEQALYLCWAAFLSRLLDQAPVALAHYYPSRGAELADALGVYCQYLPLALQLDLQSSLSTQAAALLQQRAQAESWADYSLGREQAAFAFEFREQSPSSQKGDEQDLGAVWLRSEVNGTALCLQCVANSDSLQLTLDTAANAFSAQALEILAEQFSHFLQQLCQAPDSSLLQPSLLGERQQALLNECQQPLAWQPLSLVELFEAQAARQPQAPALIQGGVVQDYARLNQRANQLARYLRELGVARGQRVALVTGTDLAMPWLMLAVLKAGAAYVPLDADYPPARLQQCLQASGASVLICADDTLAAALGADFSGQCLSVSQLNSHIARYAGDNLPAPALDDLAYVIYTSGSTGQPKGVAISHGALSHSTQARLAYYPEPPRAYLLLSSFAFDSSVAGIYWSWAAGACLVLPETGENLMPRRLLALMQLHGVSHGLSLPALWQALVEEASASADTLATLKQLKAWIVAGEACAPGVLELHQQLLPQLPLYNEYGPTEATVWASVDELNAQQGISIGRPTPGMQLHLLNAVGQPAGIGESGEIYLGGPQLAQGYQGDPQLSAQRFVELDLPGACGRYYRSGDVAAWRADGRLDFLGRSDHQVKIRGYRIELADIEQTLLAQPGVAEAVALVRQVEDQPARLLAYAVAATGQVLNVEQIQQQLAQRLPNYMLPQALVVLERLPRSPNGKLDRQALPAPEQIQTPYVAPRNALEAQLAELCAELLKRPQVGIHDNFFQLGGDSILSLQLVSRALHAGIELSARQIFSHPTIAEMASVATQVTTMSPTPDVSPASADFSNAQAGQPAFALDEAAFADLLDEVGAEAMADEAFDDQLTPSAASGTNY